ncbi:MAG: hypothetical protein ABMA02_15055, partial [Saprospiraceae bacterium]
EMSMSADSREATSSVNSPGVQLNFDGFLIGVFPGLAVVPLPSWQSEETRFRSFVTTKVVHRYGLLQTTIASDLGSEVATENLAWDSETGEVILTKTYNEHDDPVFNLNFPAHWAYRGMQAAYQNIGAQMNGPLSLGIFKTVVPGLFALGDEVMLNQTQKGWVKDIDLAAKEVYIVDLNGKPMSVPGNVGVKIIRSGHRNQQLSSIGTVTSLDLPQIRVGPSYRLDFTGKRILQASAIEYDDQWQTWCGEKTVTNTCICTPSGTGGFSTDFLSLLNSQISSGQFVVRPKSNAYYIPAGQASALKAWLNVQCPPPVGWILPPDYMFATEMTGNDLKCFFGKKYSDAKICWFECLVIKNFSIMVTAPLPTVLSFHSPSPNLSTCDGKDICFKADVLTFRDQQGSTFSNQRALTFTFCADGAECFNFFECNKVQQIVRCGWQAPGDTVNPYRLNLRGVFRPKRTWAYLTDRVPEPTASVSTGTNTRSDGYFNQFSSFWESTPSNIWRTRPAGWTWAKQATRFNPVGNEVENQDALGNFSAELTGYSNTQVTAVANNARYRQIAFEGFEDYGFDMPSCQRHFGFPLLNDTTSTTSHTGKFSKAVQPNTPVSTKYSVVSPICPPPGWILERRPIPYVLHACDCVGKFAPDPGKPYVFSAWVKENKPLGTLHYGNAAVEVKTGGQIYTFKTAGQIIEGWQRIYGEFNIPATATDIEVVLRGNGTAAWFDDLRFAPFDGSLKTFVYDPRTLRFTYELDENNYFTEYEYDAAGMLERVKKETERGVMTIQESRFGQKKQ